MKRIPYYLMTLTSIAMLSSLTGCASMMSSKMPAGSVSMEQAYNGAISGSDDTTAKITGTTNAINLNQVRSRLQPVMVESNIQDTDIEANSINNQFPRLPNPNVVMYVYPHLAGTDPNQVPVPGYSTVFPMYDHVYYAMPGEVISGN